MLLTLRSENDAALEFPGAVGEVKATGDDSGAVRISYRVVDCHEPNLNNQDFTTSTILACLNNVMADER